MPSKPTHPETIACRLTEILRRLNEGEKLDPQALAEEFGVNQRTIQRDLNERFAFLDLEKKDGVYAINQMRLGTLNFKDVQRFAILAGLQGLHPQLSTDFLKSLLDTRQHSALLIRGHNYEDLRGKEQQFRRLKHAIEECQPISYQYLKPTGTKAVEYAQPYKLVNQDGIWYLAATDAGQLKSYAFSKIDQLQVWPDNFTPDPAVVKNVSEEDSIWLNLKKTEVVLKVARHAADYFLRRKLIGGQKIEKQLEDGGLIVSGTIAHPNQILPIVRYWLPSIRVISPEGMQAELEGQLRAYLGQT